MDKWRLILRETDEERIIEAVEPPLVLEELGSGRPVGAQFKLPDGSTLSINLNGANVAPPILACKRATKIIDNE